MTSVEPTRASATPATPWASRDFRWLFAGRSVDALGNAMHPVGLGFAMLRLFDSTTALGLVVGAGSLGMVLFLLAGGVLADRLPRRVVLVWSNHVAAACQVATVVLVWAEVRNLPALAVLSFVTGAAAAFDHPASMALTPATLTPQTLHRGNAHLSLGQHTGRIVGASTAGLLTAVAGPVSALAVNAASFAVAGLCFGRIRARAGERATGSAPASALEDLRDGWQEFVRRRWVVVVVAAFFVLNAVWIGAFHVLGVAIAEDGFGPDGWGLVLAAEGVGALAGGALASRWEPTRPMVVGMLAATIAMLPIVALGWWPSLLPLLLAALVAGVAMMTFEIAWSTALQRHVPDDRLARVSSWDSLGSFAAIPLGAFVAGPLAEALGTTTVVRGAAVLAVLAGLATFLSREVRDLR